MKKRYPRILTVLLVMLLAYGVPSRARPKETGTKLEGTWTVLSIKYGIDKEFSSFPKDKGHIKLLTPTHFMWVVYDVATKKVESSAGGTYSLDGNTYREQIDFASGEVEALVGKPQIFTTKLDGDTWSLAGTLSNGLKIEEVWKRIPSKPIQ